MSDDFSEEAEEKLQHLEQYLPWTKLKMVPVLTLSERSQIGAILTRRANEIAGYKDQNRDKMPASVELGLSLEIERLRKLADKITPPVPEE